MDKADDALFVDQDLNGHPAQFQQVYFLFVLAGDLVFRGCQADEGNLLGCPVVLKGLLGVRPDGDHFRLVFDKIWIVMVQLRHMPAAERSGKPPVEDQVDVFLAFEFR